jgi:hypothetical protein
MKKRGKFAVDISSASHRWVADICLTLITSKPRPTNPSEMSSAGAVNGRCRITALQASGLWSNYPGFRHLVTVWPYMLQTKGPFSNAQH